MAEALRKVEEPRGQKRRAESEPSDLERTHREEEYARGMKRDFTQSSTPAAKRSGAGGAEESSGSGVRAEASGRDRHSQGHRSRQMSGEHHPVGGQEEETRMELERRVIRARRPEVRRRLCGRRLQVAGGRSRVERLGVEEPDLVGATTSEAYFAEA